MPLCPKALTYQVFLRRFIQFEAGLFSLRLGHGAALTCPRHVIHYRAAAALPLKLPRCSLICALLHMFFDRLGRLFRTAALRYHILYVSQFHLEIIAIFYYNQVRSTR